MKRLHAIAITLFTAFCMAAAPSLGAEKKASSESKDARSTKQRAEKKAKSVSTPQSVGKSQPKTREKPKSNDAAPRDAKAARQRVSKTTRDAPAVQREFDRKGNLGRASGDKPNSAASQADEPSARRKVPAAGSSPAPSPPRVDGARSTVPKAPSRPIEGAAAGTVGDPVADPLAKADGVASPAPTAEELQAQGRAAKGDRTSQVSTSVRVNPDRPHGEQGGGILVKEGDSWRVVDPDPESAESNASLEESRSDARDDRRDAEAEQQAESEAANERAEEEAEQQRAEAEAEEEATQDQADADAEEEEEERVAEEGGTPPDDEEDPAYRPDDVNATDYITRLTDAEIAARNAETKAGLVNPTGAGAGGGIADPNRAREIGRSASPRAGWAIDPGSGEAGGAAPDPSEVPARPDECDLAGGAAGGCDGGDGLR